jgi:ferritin-like metal-binding protein YciE
MGTEISLQEALLDAVNDLFDAEKQLLKAMARIAGEATSPPLRDAIDGHLATTRTHVERLKRVCSMLDAHPTAKHCAGISGIIEEAFDALHQDGTESVMDAHIIAALQRIAHYKIAAYGTAAAWADAMALGAVANLLRQTLDDEIASAHTLGDLARVGIKAAANELVITEERSAEARGA